MIDVNLYNFAKKLNSTSIPSGSGASLKCVLKDDRSLTSPVILINFEDPEYTPSFNYCRIRAFGRYYFIDEWTYVRGLWQARLRVDHLASFRDEIGNATEYIARSSKAYDGSIIDSRYPFKTGASLVTNSIPSGWQPDMHGGFFVVSVAGGRYGTSRYKLSSYQMFALANKLYDDSIYVMDRDVTLDKNMLNPIQYINNIQWYPIVESLRPAGTAVGDIKVGWWQSGCSGTALTGTPEVSFSWSIAVPKHPQSSSVGAWLSGSNASSYELYYHPFGSIVLDPVALKNVDSIGLNVKVDVISGMGYLNVTAGGNVIRQVGRQIAVPVQVIQNHTDTMATVSNALGATAALMTGNVAGFANGISNALLSQLPQVEMKGASGSMAGSSEPIRLVGSFLTMAEEDLANKGRPLMSHRKINTIPGYIECEDVHLTISNALQPELERIYRDMRGGFYYE